MEHRGTVGIRSNHLFKIDAMIPDRERRARRCTDHPIWVLLIDHLPAELSVGAFEEIPWSTIWLQ